MTPKIEPRINLGNILTLIAMMGGLVVAYVAIREEIAMLKATNAYTANRVTIIEEELRASRQNREGSQREVEETLREILRRLEGVRARQNQDRP